MNTVEQAFRPAVRAVEETGFSSHSRGRLCSTVLLRRCRVSEHSNFLSRQVKGTSRSHDLRTRSTQLV